MEPLCQESWGGKDHNENFSVTRLSEKELDPRAEIVTSQSHTQSESLATSHGWGAILALSRRSCKTSSRSAR